MTAKAAPSDDAAPTLELVQFAVCSAGAAWSAPLSLRSDARRIGFIGDWEPLFRLLSGGARASRGSAQILGCELSAAISRGVLGFAACDAPLPRSFTVNEYLRHAARLSHGSASRAVHDAARAQDRYGLNELGKRKLGELALYQQRALGIALATLTAPAVACLETPLRGLDAPSADYIARLCGEAAAHGRLLLSAALPTSPSAERSLLDTCDELFVHKHGALVAHGTPSAIFGARARYSLSVKGQKIADFSAALRSAGVAIEPRDRPGSFIALLPESVGVSSDLLLDAAQDHDLIVLELEPLFTV